MNHKMIKSLRNSTLDNKDSAFKKTGYSIGFSRFDALHEGNKITPFVGSNLEKVGSSDKKYTQTLNTFKKRANMRKSAIDSMIKMHSSKKKSSEKFQQLASNYKSKIKSMGRSKSMSMNASLAQFRKSNIVNSGNDSGFDYNQFSDSILTLKNAKK